MRDRAAGFEPANVVVPPVPAHPLSRGTMAERRQRVRSMTEPVPEPGYPEPGYPEPESFPVRRCLQAILNEEREHRRYAERDFDALEAGRG
jgi:hypothetical protein